MGKIINDKYFILIKQCLLLPNTGLQYQILLVIQYLHHLLTKKIQTPSCQLWNLEICCRAIKALLIRLLQL